MNTNTYKISCPNCGATNGFREDSPSKYTCGYCGSPFEHQSVIAAKSQERFLYDHFKTLITENKHIDTDHPDRNSLCYANLVQMSGCVQGLSSSTFFEEVLNEYIIVLTNEIEFLEVIGVQSDAVLQEVIQRDLIVATKFYGDYKLMLAQTLYDHKEDSSSWEKALHLVIDSEKVEYNMLQRFDHNRTGLKLDLLQRLQLTDRFKEELQVALDSTDTSFAKRIAYRFKEFV